MGGGKKPYGVRKTSGTQNNEHPQAIPSSSGVARLLGEVRVFFFRAAHRAVFPRGAVFPLYPLAVARMVV